eukprot:gb/GECH01000236.1/.p1 GENE.gb/GECH01000236.1/~~gb/GECH01000236.1/.p1  ORF type:complete len:266 (+),score=83.58 gb/GECH01000236.1/:1-798(+)
MVHHVQPPNDKELDELANNLVRYFLFMDAKKLPIKRDEVSKQVLSSFKGVRGLFERVFDMASKTLRQVFGYEIVPLKLSQERQISHEAHSQFSQSMSQSDKPKGYVLRLILENEKTNNDDENEDDHNDDDENQDEYTEQEDITLSNLSREHCREILPQRDAASLGLLSTILTLIHLNQEPISEISLWNHLNQLGIVHGTHHSEFGLPERVIENYVKQMYLERIEKPNHDTGENIVLYQSGVRAEYELNSGAYNHFINGLSMSNHS